MARVKVIEHGYFFRNNVLKTKCNCGCVYLTPKKKVKIWSGVNAIGERSLDITDYFATTCPECEKYNRQNIQELRKEMEGKHEKL